MTEDFNDHGVSQAEVPEGAADGAKSHQDKAKEFLEKHQEEGKSRLDDLTAKTAETIGWVGERVKEFLPATADSVDQMVGKAQTYLAQGDESGSPASEAEPGRPANG